MEFDVERLLREVEVLKHNIKRILAQRTGKWDFLNNDLITAGIVEINTSAGAGEVGDLRLIEQDDDVGSPSFVFIAPISAGADRITTMIQNAGSGLNSSFIVDTSYGYKFQIGSFDQMTITNNSINITDCVFTTTGQMNIQADDVKTTWGASGATDSYIQFDGANLELFSDGLIELIPSGDTDDYFTFSTVSNVPTISTTNSSALIIDPTGVTSLIGEF